MSVCTFIASDHPLPEVEPLEDYPLEINIDEGTVYDGGTEDNFFLLHFRDVQSYTDKPYGVYLEWHYTEGRGKEILKYIRQALENTDCVELWHVWLMGYYEFEDRPFLHSRTISIEDLTADDIRELDNAQIWNTPDRTYPDRPSFYRWTVTR